MAKRCRGGSLAPGPGQSWEIPTLPNHEGERQCTESGGTIEEDETTTCGATTSTQGHMVGSTSSSLMLSYAVLEPVRKLRERFAETDLVRNLDLVNGSPELVKVILSNPSIAEHLAQGVGFLSDLATSVLSGSEDAPLLQMQYSPEFHGWIAEVAQEVRLELADRRLHEALDYAVGALEAQVGRSFADIIAGMQKESTSL